MDGSNEVRAESVPLPVVWAAGSAKELEVADDETGSHVQSQYADAEAPGLKLTRNPVGSLKGLFGMSFNRCEFPLQCNTVSGPMTLDVEYTAVGAALSVEPAVKAAIQKIGAATVLIRGYGPQGKAWSGSGVVIKPDDFFPGLSGRLESGSYLLLTNHHVAGEATALVATLPNGEELEASPLRSTVSSRPVHDPVTDSAILVIRPGTVLSTATLGDSRKIEAGEVVLTAGHPAGLPKLSVTRGVISQPRQSTGFVPFPVIQFDAAINGGNSGGPLVNMDGEVIGLNTFTLKGTNDLSFAMPLHEQLKALTQIYERGFVSRSTLGVSFDAFPLYARRTSGFPSDQTGGARLSRVTGFWKRLLFSEGDVVTELRPLGGKSFKVEMDSPFDATTINAWIQELKPHSVVWVTAWREEVGADGRKVWNKFTLPMIADPLDMLNITQNAWERSAGVYLEAA